MNISEALASGKKFRIVDRPAVVFRGADNFYVHLTDCHWSAIKIYLEADYELVKEPEVYEVECSWEEHYGRITIKEPALHEFNDKFYLKYLEGKRTKLRIEVIE